MEFTLLWAALTAVGFAWMGTRIWPERLPDHATDRMVGAAAAGLLVGRLSAMLLQGTNPLSNPGDILIVRGGVHTGTATAAAIATYLWAAKWKVAYLDATSPAALMGLGGWHAGCLWRNACLGSGSDLPWAWAQEGSLITRHPVELYTAVGLMTAAWLVSRLPWRLLTKSGVALALAGLVR
ncbi:MAG: prolipoprotein diacylglyceryl transferase, partial [Actinobacteria bacterium]|nr:prolipoprotein diacylglyceryl transferase [Actinomycetota bacterium]